MKKRAYSAKCFRDAPLDRILSGRDGADVVAGIDVSKADRKVVLRWADGQFERPWTVKNPGELREFIALMRKVAAGRNLRLAMEATGTYGDALRQVAHDEGLTLHQVNSKAAHDYAEVFDGVASQHDGKDAAVVAELCALGKSSVWAFAPPDAFTQELAFQVDWIDAQRRHCNGWCCRLEGLLARHWPEAFELSRVSSMVLIRTLKEFGGPSELVREADAAGRMYSWGRHRLAKEKIARLIESARTTTGIRQAPVDVHRMKLYAGKALDAHLETQRCLARLSELAEGHPVLQAHGAAIGVPTACVLWYCVGDPRKYGYARAYRRAMGLNLTERSSGMYKGKPHVSKRGSSMARHWLYLSALRMVRLSPPVKDWYARKRAEGKNAVAVITAISRRLAAALHSVAVNGDPFDASLLFPGRPLVAGRGEGGDATVTG